MKNTHWSFSLFYLLIIIIYVCVCVWLQNAEASDEDDEGKALMIRPGLSSAKEEKDNEAFFKKVKKQTNTMNINFNKLKDHPEITQSGLRGFTSAAVSDTVIQYS